MLVSDPFTLGKPLEASQELWLMWVTSVDMPINVDHINVYNLEMFNSLKNNSNEPSMC